MKTLTITEYNSLLLSKYAEKAKEPDRTAKKGKVERKVRSTGKKTVKRKRR